MTIQLELSPNAEARLTTEARARGIDLERHAESLLEMLLAPPTQASGQLSASELETMLRQMSEGSETLPKLPTAAFTRESFYEDLLL